MQYKAFKNSPLFSHPLADQSEWYADDAAIQTLEGIWNHKQAFTHLFPLEKPTKMQEGGQDIYPSNGGLSIASTRS